MKLRNILLIGGAGLLAYYFFMRKDQGKPAGLPDIGELAGGFGGGAAAQFPTLAGGAQVGADLFTEAAKWNPLINPLGYAESVFSAISGALSPPQAAPSASVNPNLGAQAVAGKLNEWYSQGGNAPLFEAALMPSLRGTSSISVVRPLPGVNVAAGTRAAQIMGLQTGYGIATAKGGGIITAGTQVYMPSAVSLKGSTITASSSGATARRSSSSSSGSSGPTAYYTPAKQQYFTPAKQQYFTPAKQQYFTPARK